MAKKSKSTKSTTTVVKKIENKESGQNKPVVLTPRPGQSNFVTPVADLESDIDSE